MAKYGSADFTLFLVDGYSLVASLMETVTRSKEAITQQTNPLGADSEQHTPVGIEKFMLTVGGGFYDPTTDALHTALTTVVGISRVICVGSEGNTIGKHFTGYEGALSTKYEVQDTNGGLTKANVSYLVSGKSEEGVIVQHLTAFTADWDTKTGGAGATDAPVDYTLDTSQRVIPITSNSIANPTIVTTPVAHGLTNGDIILISGVATSDPTINGQQVATVTGPTTFSVPVNVTTGGTGGTFVRANSSGGGVGYLQNTAGSGFTNFVGTIQDSPDDITYAALVTFADSVADPQAQRIEVSGTVDRYLSFNGNVTGAGTITVFSGFARG